MTTEHVPVFLESHRSKLSNEPNTKITIAAFEPGAGGSYTHYKVGHDDSPAHVDIVFQTLERKGLTNEVLLAIVLDRLQGFQKGEFPCSENAEAILGVAKALDALKRRTLRRGVTGMEGKLVEKIYEAPPQADLLLEKAPPRIRQEGNHVRIGDTVIPTDAILEHSTAAKIVSACIQLDPPYDYNDQLHLVGILYIARVDNVVISGIVDAIRKRVVAKEVVDELNARSWKGDTLAAIEPKERVTMTSTTLSIGNAMILATDLESWSGWSYVEKAAKSLKPKITPCEFEVIVKFVVAHPEVNQNGWSEFRQAMAQA